MHGRHAAGSSPAIGLRGNYVDFRFFIFGHRLSLRNGDYGQMADTNAIDGKARTRTFEVGVGEIWEGCSRDRFRDYWTTEPGISRVANGIPRMDRVRVLGNAVVPQVGEYVGRTLLNLIKELNVQD